jgi:hypothetical protein
LQTMLMQRQVTQKGRQAREGMDDTTGQTVKNAVQTADRAATKSGVGNAGGTPAFPFSQPFSVIVARHGADGMTRSIPISPLQAGQAGRTKKMAASAVRPDGVVDRKNPFGSGSTTPPAATRWLRDIFFMPQSAPPVQKGRDARPRRPSHCPSGPEGAVCGCFASFGPR